MLIAQHSALGCGKAMKKLVYLLLVTAMMVGAAVVQAQQPVKIPRVGFLSTRGGPKNPGPSIEAFRQGLRSLGYIEGKNIQRAIPIAIGALPTM